MRWIMVVFAALLAGAAPAQTVRKCVGRDGGARYQTEPCRRGDRTAGTWDAVAEPAVVRSVPQRRSGPVAAARTRPRRRPVRQAAPADACADARAYRDDAERRAGLARNYELLSALQRRVFDACR